MNDFFEEKYSHSPLTTLTGSELHWIKRLWSGWLSDIFCTAKCGYHHFKKCYYMSWHVSSYVFAHGAGKFERANYPWLGIRRLLKNCLLILQLWCSWNRLLRIPAAFCESWWFEVGPDPSGETDVFGVWSRCIPTFFSGWLPPLERYGSNLAQEQDHWRPAWSHQSRCCFQKNRRQTMHQIQVLVTQAHVLSQRGICHKAEVDKETFLQSFERTPDRKRKRPGPGISALSVTVLVDLTSKRPWDQHDVGPGKFLK